MSASASGQPDTPSTLVELLERAARRLTARLEPFSPMEGELSREDIQDELDHLLDHLRAALSEDSLHVLQPSSLRPGLQLQLVTELSDEIVAMALDDGAPHGCTGDDRSRPVGGACTASLADSPVEQQSASRSFSGGRRRAGGVHSHAWGPGRT